MAAKIRQNDEVIVLAGKDKGKNGKVLQVLRKKDRVVVEGINIVKRHQKPTNTNQTGGILEKEAPIHISNVKVSEKSEKATKIVKEEKKEVKKVRVSKKSNEKTV